MIGDGVAVLVDKNRIKSGIFAIEHLGCDTLLLDDGMQYLKLAHELDIVLVDCGAPFGTGALLRMGIVGRDGFALTEHWADGPTTFLGVATAGFPNLFFPGGPHAAAGNNPRYNGDQVDFVHELLCEARRRGATVVEATPEAEGRWTAMIDRAADQPPSFGKSSYFFGANVPGKPRRYLLNAGGRPKLVKEIARVKDTGWAAFSLGG